MARIKVEVESREGLGTNQAKKLRKKDIIPGIIYGSDTDPISISVDRRTLEKVYKEAGESTLIDLTLDGENVPVIIKEIQKHPYKNEYLHVDFHQLNMKEMVTVTVPIVLVGEENVDKEPAMVVQQLDEIDIECLPLDIPQILEVDVSNIDFDTPIFVSDLEIFGNDDFTILRDGEDVIASLVLPDEEPEEEEEEALDADEVPVVGEEEEEESEEASEE